MENPNDAVILNYSQNPVEYQNVPKVWLTHPDSTEEEPVLVPFTYGEAVKKTVEPDFAAGDMPVEIPEGELVTELTVKKPEELVPENIPEGMYIAGVGPGTFVGGGSGNIKITGGRTGAVDAATISHGLGVIPDIIIVTRGNIKGALCYAMALGDNFYNAVKSVAPYFKQRFYAYCTNSDSAGSKDFYWGENAPGIRDITAETFTVGSSTYKVGTDYGLFVDDAQWIAISGLC